MKSGGFHSRAHDEQKLEEWRNAIRAICELDIYDFDQIIDSLENISYEVEEVPLRKMSPIK